MAKNQGKIGEFTRHLESLRLPRMVQKKDGTLIAEETVLYADWGRKKLQATDLIRVLMGFRDLLNSIDFESSKPRDFNKENLREKDLKIVNKRIL